MYGLLARKRLDGWTATFLTTTVATSLTGFGFPFHGFTPAVGILSLVFLAFAIGGRYRHVLARSWRWIYVISATDIPLLQRLRFGSSSLPEDTPLKGNGAD